MPELRSIKDTPQRMETLEFNLEWVTRRQSGIVATMTAIDIVKAASLRKPEDLDTHTCYSCYAVPNPYDYDAANQEIGRLDWVIGLIKEDIVARDKLLKG